MKKIVLMGLTILISINMVACSNKSVAKVNDVDVSKEEYKRTEEFLYATGYVEKDEKNSNEINNDILSFIIDNEVAYQEAQKENIKEAQKENIKVKDSDVNEKIEQLKETLETNTTYKEKLESAGITDDFLKEQVKKDLTVAKYKENFIKDIKVTDKEMEAYYNNNKEQFNVEEVKASQILISTLDEDNKEVSKEQKEKLKEKAQSILDKVNNNEDFASLAKKYSDDKNSGKEMEAYYNNNEDQFNVEEVKASQILISTLDEDNKEVSKEQKEKLKEKAQSILDKVNNNEDFASLAKKYSDDKNSGKDGGDLGYFAKNEKNIEFTKEVFKLDTNQISKLIETSYGYHIVKVTDKTTVTKSLEDSKDDIKTKILNEKYTKHIDSLYKKGKITIT